MTLTGPMHTSRVRAATTMFLLAATAGSSLAMSETTKSAGADRGAVLSTPLAMRASALQVLTPNAASSLAKDPNSVRLTNIILSNNVIVKGTQSQLNTVIAQFENQFGGLAGVRELGSKGDTWGIEVATVADAIDLANAINMGGLMDSAFVDSGEMVDNAALEEMLEPTTKRIHEQRLRATAPGIQPVDDDTVDPLGVLDPNRALQWHFQNGLPIYSDRDNNVTDAIYDTLGVDGTGVVIGIVRASNLEHFERAHTDLTANFNSTLTQPVDLNLLAADRTLTAQVGLAAAERNNGLFGHGIAPGAQFATISTGTSLQYSNMLEHEQNSIAIKVVPTAGTLSQTSDGFNSGQGNEFVRDSFLNALQSGRNGLGTVFVFAGGFSVNSILLNGITGNVPLNSANPYTSRTGVFYPDPYDAAGVPELFADNDMDSAVDGNIFLVTESADTDAQNNSWLAGPNYVMAQSSMFPFANDRRTLLINGVGEDGNADVAQAIGPGVFASVYSGTSNTLMYTDNGLAFPPRGTFSTVPGVLFQEFPDPSAPLGSDLTNSNNNSATIAGGILALMLDANPNLSLRDIQHILFESIYDSTLSQATRFPSFNPNLPYLGTNIGLNTGDMWQVNTAIIDTVNGPTSVRHSDQYGFGVIDAEVAVTKALSWQGVPPLVVLDTGVVTEDTEAELGFDEGRVPLEIADATFRDAGMNATGGMDFILEPALAETDHNDIDICVRNNLVIESIVLELTIAGEGNNDLAIELISPNGTRSNLLYPTTTNFLGTSFTENTGDDELDLTAFNGGVAEYAFFRHEFTSFKHWGELSGGPWSIRVHDFGPDESYEEGTMSDGMDPAEVNRYFLGPIGVPGSDLRDVKEIEEFRFRIYGYESGADPFLGCDPFVTTCPGDLNADGIISTADLLLFISWWQAGDFRADLNNNGVLDYFDLFTYLQIFQPGFCTVNQGGDGQPGFTGGRPHPDTADPSDDNPPVRPI